MFESRAFLSDLPVTLVTGYLGSGKTTYINERLSDAHGVRYAVMVNDFGELNIDAELIAASTERTISLTNGCVCCSLADDMDAAMEQVQQLAHELDWVLFEASGVADPERIKTKIEARPGFALREFLTIIDVTRIKSLAQDKYIGQHIKRQLQLTHPSTPDSTNVQDIEYGTRLSKTDLLSAAAIADVQSWLAHFNSNNESDCDDARKSDGMPRFFTRTVEKTGFLNRKIFEHWLSTVGPEIIRMKGFVYLTDDNMPDLGATNRYLLQWVSGQWSLELFNSGGSETDGPRRSRLIMISHAPIGEHYAEH